MSPLLLVAALGIGAALLCVFVTLENRGHPGVVVALLVGSLVVESLLLSSQESVGGILRPAGFRLPELLIGLGLAARVLAHGIPNRATVTGIAWALVWTWYLTAVVVGYLIGNPVPEVLVQAKAIVYVGGGYALVAGVPVRTFLSRKVLGGWVVALGVVVAVMVPLALSGFATRVALPGLVLPDFGRVGADASTVLVTVAVIAVVVECSRRRRRPALILAALPMLATPFAANQRAAVVGLVASLLVLLVAAMGPTWKRNIRITPTEIGMGLAALLALGLAFSIMRVDQGADVPGVAVYEDLFESTSKQQSAETRLLQWDVGTQLVSERPILGWGLGKQFTTYRPGLDEYLEGGGFHMIALDLLVRTGLVGLLLFVVAAALSLRDGWRTWHEHPNPVVATFALAVTAALVGLLVKAQVESLFEKARLAALLGLLLGAVASAEASRREGLDGATLPEQESGRETLAAVS